MSRLSSNASAKGELLQIIEQDPQNTGMEQARNTRLIDANDEAFVNAACDCSRINHSIMADSFQGISSEHAQSSLESLSSSIIEGS